MDIEWLTHLNYYRSFNKFIEINSRSDYRFTMFYTPFNKKNEILLLKNITINTLINILQTRFLYTTEVYKILHQIVSDLEFSKNLCKLAKNIMF